MLKKTGGVAALLGMVALSVFLLNCGSSDSRPAGLLYVISQAEFNITSFSINLLNGEISLINSNATTCTTLTGSNPTTCGLALNMLLGSTGSTAFVLNQGISVSSIPPTIYGYTVNSDGSLSSPTTSATLPVGDTSVTMTADAAGDLLFVIDQGSNLNPTDCPIPNSNTYGTDCPSIQVFSTTPGSTTLTQASVFTLDRMPTAISAITFTPPNAPSGTSPQTLLFMTSNKDLLNPTNPNDNELSVYAVDSSGNLTEQPNSPYTTNPNPGVVLAVNTNAPPQTTGGVFVYVGNQGSTSGSIAAFQLCTVVGTQGNSSTSCTQTQVQNNQLISIGTPSAAGQQPIAMVVDPSNSFLYVASYASSQIFAFHIATGTGLLSALAPASEPTGAQPVALAMHGNYNVSGEFLYTSNNNGQSITEFSFGAFTGALGNGNTVLFLPGQPYGMAAK